MSNMHIGPAPAGGDALVSRRLSWDTSASFEAAAPMVRQGSEKHNIPSFKMLQNLKSSRIYKKDVWLVRDFLVQSTIEGENPLGWCVEWSTVLISSETKEKSVAGSS